MSRESNFDIEELGLRSNTSQRRDQQDVSVKISVICDNEFFLPDFYNRQKLQIKKDGKTQGLRHCEEHCLPGGWEAIEL